MRATIPDHVLAGCWATQPTKLANQPDSQWPSQCPEAIVSQTLFFVVFLVTFHGFLLVLSPSCMVLLVFLVTFHVFLLILPKLTKKHGKLPKTVVFHALQPGHRGACRGHRLSNCVFLFFLCKFLHINTIGVLSFEQSYFDNYGKCRGGGIAQYPYIYI